MMEFNPSLQMEDVNVLSEAVRTWYRHNHATPTEQSTQLLCSAAVDLYNQGHRTREELVTLLIMKFASPDSLKVNAPSSTSHH
ncbi:hypothetical protein [Rhizobium leguminosarum]|uniref:hypothetical protein n=1 Tax=Rhizobium leguminosarum TaxID=384 RepID=UPI00098FB345|nr:hypothetical protein [Rhizobium leguminosarum]MBB5261773.1 hypothetical protein [Rhizobium leguminosarum]MBY5485392.1 hypothetical protein [Rhizobium leguminosarum]MDX6000586.1 hypothetical protein [Rhizobium leguminosarum]OOO44752.1 hypothetical protein BS629_26375 [Rhizobium leguminosarum bv. viciae USDA 2370]PUB64908.1 hypothetical protein DB728_09345 [Rhizobium leguminosarum bv. viciae USDA 2370]